METLSPLISKPNDFPRETTPKHTWSEAANFPLVNLVKPVVQMSRNPLEARKEEPREGKHPGRQVPLRCSM